MDFETNYIYLFDRSEVEQYRKEGLSRVFHMPLATDPDLFDKMSAGKDTAGIKRNLTSEISFVGNLYTSYDYNAMLLSMPENSYFKGYIRGLVSAQSNLFNYWIIPDLINDKVTRYVKNETGADELTRKQLVFLIANYITYKDRLMILKMAKKVSDDVALYSYKVNDSEKSMLASVDIRPSVDYLTEMPYVFRHSKINLCPTLRCIGTGIPLRMLDIMASHGFLLCNAQSELMEYFDSNDCAMYSSYEEAYDLMQFFIRNDGIRERCVENAYAKIQAAFRMDDRIKMIFEMSNVKL
jgi:spore maturation protein CgeB